METKNYLEDLKKRGEKKVRVFTREQVLADEIYSYFSKRISFGQIMGMIRQKGWQGIYDAFQDIKKNGGAIKDPVSLFIFKVKEQKVQWAGDKKVAVAGNP